MAISSSIKEWFNNQTSMEKLSIMLTSLSFPVHDVYSAFQFAGMAILTAWIWHRQKTHKEKMTNL